MSAGNAFLLGLPIGVVFTLGVAGVILGVWIEKMRPR